VELAKASWNVLRPGKLHTATEAFEHRILLQNETLSPSTAVAFS